MCVRLNPLFDPLHDVVRQSLLQRHCGTDCARVAAGVPHLKRVVRPFRRKREQPEVGMRTCTRTHAAHTHAAHTQRGTDHGIGACKRAEMRRSSSAAQRSVARL
jgi:hypothetical protein